MDELFQKTIQDDGGYVLLQRGENRIHITPDEGRVLVTFDGLPGGGLGFMLKPSELALLITELDKSLDGLNAGGWGRASE